MRLRKIHIINHKSLKNISLDLSNKSYATLIGLNDAGKSTILKSVQLLLDEKATIVKETETSQIKAVSNSPLDAEDFANLINNEGLPSFEYNPNNLVIFGEFIVERIYSFEEIDEIGISDHLQCVLNEKSIGDSIYLLKEFGQSEDNYYICCNDYTDSNKQNMELWNKNQNELKSIQQIHGIKDEDVRNENKSGPLKKIERARAIYSTLTCIPSWSKFDYKKDRKYFPEFNFLDWNISADQIDNIVSAALNPAIDQSVKEIQAHVNAKRDEINDGANKLLQEIYSKYSSHLPNTIIGLKANIDVSINKRVTELFVEKLTGDKKIHISDQGDGIKRQIGLGLIRALAEESIEKNNSEVKYIWVVDEPETHLYPQAQRELATSLQRLSNSNFQIIVSTHSLTFVDRAALTDVNKVELHNGYTVIATTENNEDALKTLGVRNSDFLFFDKFLAVEGPTEYFLLDHMYRLLYGNELFQDGIKIISLGGQSNSTHYKKIFQEILDDYRKENDVVIYMLDKDTNNIDQNVVLIGSIADFEDSLSNTVWKKLLIDKCGVRITDSELDAMRTKISVSDSQKKLHNMLKNFVAEKGTRTAFLNSKGERLALDLKEAITNESLVPQCIKDAFEAARK